MGNLEESGRKRKKRRDLKKAILQTVKAAALLGIAIAAPNVPAALYKLGIIRFDKQDSSTISRTRKQLIHTGYIADQKGFLRITAKGQAILQKLEMSEALKRRPRRWDGRWRVLIFDVPEYRKGIREKIRRSLDHIGFVRLQDSVWIFPYDCEDFIVLLKADFKIGKDVLYMIVDELEGDRWLRKHFNLSARK